MSQDLKDLINVSLCSFGGCPMPTETPLKLLVDVNGYASTNMQLFYMLKSYDYIILYIFIFIL